MGKFRLLYRVVGTARAVAMRDRIVRALIEKLKEQIEIIHVSPTGSLETVKAAIQLGMPTVLERSKANTRFVLYLQ